MSGRALIAAALAAALGATATRVAAADAAQPIGEPELETPTLQSLGVRWLIHGDDNADATVELAYRAHGAQAWRAAPPLWRVSRRSTPYADQSRAPRAAAIAVPEGAWLFAGSALLLTPDTAYDLRVRLHDPDGGDHETLLAARTAAEPVAPPTMRDRHVVPEGGDGAPGDGSATAPLRGLAAAQAVAKPGDRFLLHAGTYRGEWKVTASGRPDAPIIWAGAGDGEAIIDGGHPLEKLEGATIDAPGVDDVWFEDLTIRGAYFLLRAMDANRLVVRRCHLDRGIMGIVSQDTRKDRGLGFFIADNVIHGDQPWPVTMEQWHDAPERRAIWVGGSGHTICHNRIDHVKDGIDTADAARCDAIDICDNDVSECIDDGSELDGSERNVRSFRNRFVNVLVGLSFQPIYGGPVYAFRNLIVNPRGESLKLHNSPSGVLLVHNTILAHGPAVNVSTTDAIDHIVTRDNLFLGGHGRLINCEPSATACDLDDDGFLPPDDPRCWLKWNRVFYPTHEDAIARTPIERHAVIVDPQRCFANGTQPPADDQTVIDPATVDLRLAADSAAIGAAVPLDGFGQPDAPTRPDLGALQTGEPLPAYGPRPRK